MKKGLRKTFFINPWFDRFLANAMAAPVSKPAAALLHEEDMRYMADPSSFIAEASLEEKLVMLSKLGYPFALSVGAPTRPPAKDALLRMISVFFKALSFKRQDAMRVFKEKFFFMLADSEVIKGLKLASHIMHSPASALLPGYAYVSDLVYQYTHGHQKEHMKDQAAAGVIDNIVLKVMQLTILGHNEAFRTVYGLDDRQFLVLAYVSRMREVSLNDLTVYTHRMKNISAVLTSLVQLGYLETKPVVARGTKTDARPHYWVTGVGEQVLHKARKYFIT